MSDFQRQCLAIVHESITPLKVPLQPILVTNYVIFPLVSREEKTQWENLTTHIYYTHSFRIHSFSMNSLIVEMDRI